MEYTVASSEDETLLCGLVNLCIDQGWRPQGGVSVTQTVIDHPGQFGMPGKRECIRYFSQAMIKE
jgi:hypothetical protein